MRWLLLPCILLVSCDYEETTKETGHKGKARINPFLAAERFLESYEYEIESKPGWPDLDDEMSMALVPASALSARSYVRDIDEWVRYGGHAVVLLSGGESWINDWDRTGFNMFGDEEESPEAFAEWIEELNLELETGGDDVDDKASAEMLEFEGEQYEVFMEAEVRPREHLGQAGMIWSKTVGEGRVTVVADARPFRNRWIGDYDHAELLLRLAEISPYYGSTTFVRNVSLSFWSLLWERAWPAVIGLLLLIAFWLWKSLPRSGPLDSHEGARILRAYDHHLEALGDFHWRLDRAEGLLRPLRDNLLERAHRLALTSGNRDLDVFELIAERAGIPRERAQRAMTFERSKDAGSFTRLVADLQTIHLSIP